MTKRKHAIAILVALALVASIPHVSMAQNIQSTQVLTAQADAAEQYGQNASQPPIPPAPVDQSQAGGGSRQAPQPAGGVATVVAVDQPENCLRIRSGPGNSYDVIGCANMGDQLDITGVWTSNDWAQLADNGWVYGPQIQTDLRPPRTAYSQSPSYVVTEEVTPDYGDWSYLPDYGYNTYWYGGVPIYLYNYRVWHRFHPWWWHRGHHAWWWHRGHRGKRAWNDTEFRNFVRTGNRGGIARHRANVSSFDRNRIRRGITTNRANVPSPNINRFNANRLRSGSTNVTRSRSFSTPNVTRSRNFSTPNVTRSRSFSTPNVTRSRSFSTPNVTRSRSFSSPSGFRSGNIGARSLGGSARSGGFSRGHIGGGGGRVGGGGRHR